MQKVNHETGRTLPTEMTTAEAAEFLDLSDRGLLKLIKDGTLPCRTVRKHRAIPTAALLEYREKQFQEGQKAADEMTRLAQDVGLYELDGPPPEAP